MVPTVRAAGGKRRHSVPGRIAECPVAGPPLVPDGTAEQRMVLPICCAGFTEQAFADCAFYFVPTAFTASAVRSARHGMRIRKPCPNPRESVDRPRHPVIYCQS